MFNISKITHSNELAAMPFLPCKIARTFNMIPDNYGVSAIFHLMIKSSIQITFDLKEVTKMKEENKLKRRQVI